MVNYSLGIKRLAGALIFRDNRLHKTSELIEPGDCIYNFLSQDFQGLLCFFENNQKGYNGIFRTY